MARGSNPNLKRANAETEYTAEHLKELKKCSEDPIYFIKNYCMILHPLRGIVPFELYDYQEELVKSYQNNRFNIVLSARQTGKEQPHSSKIATPKGWTTMGEIQPGDSVLTPDGKTSIVLEKFPQGVKDVYKVIFDDGSSAECGIDHLWSVYIRNKWDPSAANGHGGYVVTKQTLSLREIISYREKQQKRKNKSNYNVRIPVVETVGFEEVSLPLDPYVLGCILGDGSISQPYNLIITSNDDQIINSINERIKPINMEAILIETGNGIDYKFKPSTSTNQLRTILSDLKLIGCKSDTKFIPQIYQEASHNQRLQLLQGLMDTDGTVLRRNSKTTITYSTTSEQLRDGVQQLVWSLGGRCSFSVRHPQNSLHKTAYDLYVSLPNPKDCFKLDRKKSKCHDVWRNNIGHETDIRRTIVDIQKVRQEESSCIIIDHPDHLYITDNYTVTHNTQTSAAFILWYTAFQFNKTVLIASNKNNNAMEIVYRLRIMYENLPDWLKPGISQEEFNKHNIMFDNGSRVLSTATTEESGRGLSISLLMCDEFAFVKPRIQEEFWASIYPTLSTGGRCIIASTPNGDMNLFAQLWRGAEVDSNGFHPTFVHWTAPPGRDEEFKRDTIARMGKDVWDQEYECKFLSSDSLLIDTRILSILTKQMENSEPDFKKGGFCFWYPKPGEERFNNNGKQILIIGIDPATGVEKDYSVIQAMEFPSMKQVAEFRSNITQSGQLYKTLKLFLKFMSQWYSTVYFSIENNGIGEGIIALYQNDESPLAIGDLISEEGKNRLGMVTTQTTKKRAASRFKNLIETGKWHFNSKMMLAELKMYGKFRGTLQAQSGGTDDIISSCLIVTRIIDEISLYEQAAFEQLYSSDIDMQNESLDDIVPYKTYDEFGGFDDDDEEFEEPMPITF